MDVHWERLVRNELQIVLRLHGCTHCGRSRGTANPQLVAAVMHLQLIVNAHTEQLIYNELQVHLF